MNGKAGLILALGVVAGGACNPAATLVSSSDQPRGRVRGGVVQFPVESVFAYLTESRRQSAQKIIREYCYPQNLRIIERSQDEVENSNLSIRFECAGSLSAVEEEDYRRQKYLKRLAEEDVILSGPN